MYDLFFFRDSIIYDISRVQIDKSKNCVMSLIMTNNQYLGTYLGIPGWLLDSNESEIHVGKSVSLPENSPLNLMLTQIF